MNIHGKVKLSWNKDLFIIEAFGPFNDEGIEHYNELIKKAIISRVFESWRRLEIWDNEVLGSPSVLDKCKEMYRWYEEQSCEASAVVVSNRIQEIILVEKINTSAEIFTTTEKAKSWLNMSCELNS
ncbi:hypothetical protein [Pseudoalteromonas atlantica]|uniref:hypothetical protein n=1 Tax=Pseudoalteromonas atlantica TaxID=288 RepID=UPI0037351261